MSTPHRLNDEQEKAARHLDGPLLIDAGAGSGKTRTLTHRIVNALTPGAVPGWQPASVDEILAITFTEKAAGEIGERVRRALRAAGRVDDARRLDAAWFSTIHGLCARLLRAYALEAGIDPGFRVLDGVESHRMRERAFAEAAEEAIGSPAGEALFGTYGFEAVSTAVERLERELVTRGLDADALELEPVPDAVRLLEEARALFERVGAAWEACGSTAASAEKQREACDLTCASLAGLDPDRSTSAGLAMEVWDVLDAHPKPPTRLKGAEEIIAEMGPERSRLLAEAACAATAPAAGALKALVGAYGRRYAALKRAAGGLDFDDLQLEALRLLRRRPDVAERERRRFRLVMVDEFQDTDRLQLELVRALSGKRLCTVGDERQSIYGFRGADLDVYREHVRAMHDAGALSVPLAENYRSHPDILAFVNAAFSVEALFGADFLPLRPMRDETGRPGTPWERRVRAVTVARKGTTSVVSAEAAAIAERFAELQAAGVPAGSMAILLRTYTHADEYAAAVRSRGMQALVVGGSRFFERAEVQVLRALCRVLANVNDDEALALVLASPLAGLSDDALWLLRNDPATGRRRGSLAQPLLAGEVALPPADAEAAALAVAVVERARARVGRMSLSEVLLRALEESAWDLRLLAEGDAGRHAYANVLKFAGLADAFEAGGGAGPAAFVEHLDTKEASGDHEAPASLADDASPCVRIMSIHASKGLEFPVVALPQLGDGVRSDRGPVRWSPREGGLSLALALPSDRCRAERSKTNVTPWFAAFDEAAARADEEEAKRLFYVACTRAEEVLLLTGATNLEDEATSRSPLDRLLQARSEVRSAGGDLPMAWERIEIGELEDVPADDEDAEQAAAAPATARAQEPAFPPAPPSEAPPSPPSAPERLSYSDVALYRRCGLRFYAEKVLRLGSLSDREGSDAAAFGSAVHAALQLAVAEEPVDAGRMTAIGRAFGLPADEKPRLTAAVEGFLASDLAAELAACENVRTEVPFAIPIGEPGFLLRGTIDAYGRDGAAGLIVDYKTGTSGSEAELRDHFALQAACYALVALRDGCERVRVVFVRPEVSEAGGPQRVEYAFGPEHAGLIGTELVAEHARMAAGEYGALAARDESVCRGCAAANTICPLAAG